MYDFLRNFEASSVFVKNEFILIERSDDLSRCWTMYLGVRCSFTVMINEPFTDQIKDLRERINFETWTSVLLLVGSSHSESKKEGMKIQNS